MPADPALRAVIDEAFADHDRVLKAAVAELSGPPERAAALLIGTFRQGGKAILFGMRRLDDRRTAR